MNKRIFSGVLALALAVLLPSGVSFAHYYFLRAIANPTSTTSAPVLGTPTTTTQWACVRADGTVNGQLQATQASAETACGSLVASDGITRFLEERVTTSRQQTTTTSTRRFEVLGGTTLRVSDAHAQLLIAGPGGAVPKEEDEGGGGGGDRSQSALWPGTTRTASSCNRNDVASAIAASSPGDIVQIPNGSCTWTSGVEVSQILVRAQNYTATPAGTEGSGTTSRSTTITNNSDEALFTFTSGNSYHTGIAGLGLVDGDGDGAHVHLTGYGTKVPLLWDLYVESNSRNFPQVAIFEVDTRGGVMWNVYMECTQNVLNVGEGSMRIKLTSPSSPLRWVDPSTMGAADTNGDINFYVEDSTFKNCGSMPDLDDHGRFVARHFVYDGTWGVTHGFTSSWGGRFAEYYDGIFDSNTSARNISNRYFWLRAGTALFTGNTVYEDLVPSDYNGNPVQLNIGDNTSPSGSYLIPRQPGSGHNGTSYVSDPVYIWDQDGDFPYAWSFQDDPGDWSTVVQLNRDIFVNSGAKPGWTRFTYPHPLRVEQ